jgi:hypothetical protein
MISTEEDVEPDHHDKGDGAADAGQSFLGGLRTPTPVNVQRNRVAMRKAPLAFIAGPISHRRRREKPW